MGGVGVNVPVIGGKYTADQTFTANVASGVTAEALDKEAIAALQQHYEAGQYIFEPRVDIYNELLKLPLRFQLHPFDKLKAACDKSAVGYTPPLGVVDVEDTIPFHVHRIPDGRFGTQIISVNAHISMPSFYLRLTYIEGDLFRFEEELMKIFPTKKIFVKIHSLIVGNANIDAEVIVKHWLLGLGF